jgi:hypothetical protein
MADRTTSIAGLRARRDALYDNLIEQLEKVQAALIAAQGRVIWADGPPPDGAEGEWLVDGPFGAVIAEWDDGQWLDVGMSYDPREITSHARLE